MPSPRVFLLVVKTLSLIFFISLSMSTTTAAFEAREFDTESQRQRYNVLIDELRCPKCQNQNLAGSNSQIAEDLRRELHRLLTEGNSDREIKDFMVARYGDFVLYKPPLKASTIALWALPVILLLMGAIGLVMIIRQRARTNTNVITEALSANEQQQLDQLLKSNDSPEEAVSSGADDNTTTKKEEN